MFALTLLVAYPFTSEVHIPPVLPPIGTTGNGTCGPTDYGKDCNVDPKGSFPGMPTLEACVAKLKGCKMANFASWSLGWNDCSWYTECDWDHLCSDVTKAGPDCPATPAPVYHPFTSKVLRIPPAPGPITVGVDWSKPTVTTSTAATVEVDVMPFLGEQRWGGPFQGYSRALSTLGSEFVRYAPWFANPRVVVPELTPHTCSASQPAANWNSTYFDEIMADFQHAVCGPDAARGVCKHSVVQQLSTMPAWMYKGGYSKPLPANPWNTTDPFNAYAAGGGAGGPNVRPDGAVLWSAGVHAAAATRGACSPARPSQVGWYTAGGFHDECGHFHPSDFHYQWWGLSVLNEDEHGIKPGNGVAYTTCYDAIKVEVTKVNPKIVLVGPEIVGGGWSWPYMKYFLDKANHKDGQAPPVASWHWFGGYIANATGEDIMDRWLHDLTDPGGIVVNIDETVKASRQRTEVVLNEFIPFITDWCNCTGLEQLCGGKALPDTCPNWQQVSTGGGQHDSSLAKGIGINRASWSWNAAAAVFALGYATLAELGYKYVGADQLVGGVWPDNEPAVSCLDWQTGEPNAKFFAIQLLASTVGTGASKTLYATNITGGPPIPPVHAMAYQMAAGSRGVLLVNKKAVPLSVQLPDIAGTATVIEVGQGPEPGFALPVSRPIGKDGKLELGPYAIAVVAGGT